MAKDNMTKKLFNNGHRTIQYGRGELAPKKADKFTEEEAKKLLELFAGELLDMDNIGIDDFTRNDDASVQVSLSEQEAGIKRRLEQARKAKAEKAYEEAIKEGFDEKKAKEIAGIQ